MTTTHKIETAEADIAYDVHGSLRSADGLPPLFMIGQPMAATGFASLFAECAVLTYEPRAWKSSARDVLAVPARDRSHSCTRLVPALGWLF